jgi:hypothetical protein
MALFILICQQIILFFLSLKGATEGGIGARVFHTVLIAQPDIKLLFGLEKVPQGSHTFVPLASIKFPPIFSSILYRSPQIRGTIPSARGPSESGAGLHCQEFAIHRQAGPSFSGTPFIFGIFGSRKNANLFLRLWGRSIAK